MPRPPGKGPVLGGSRVSNKIALIAGSGVPSQLIVYVSLYTWSDGGPFDWMGLWWMWALIAIVPAYVLLFWRGSTVSVGADWLMQNKRRWVATYDLVSVEVSGEPTDRYLNLEDRDRRFFRLRLHELQEKPWIWDYAYNGILHSVVEGGAEADAETRLQLRLPPAPDDDPDPR